MTDITILTQTACASCVQAKKVLSGLAHEYPLEIREVSLETEEGRGLAARTGVVFAPGILVNGELFSYGRLSDKKLRRHLSRGQGPGSHADPGADA